MTGESPRQAFRGAELTFVNATGTGCQIFRESTGRYVVSHDQQPRMRVQAATLAGAYAACRTWEQRVSRANPAR
jgi:hypothetical protein